jgi:hypothetical protein
VKSSTEKDAYYLTILRGNADLKMDLGRYSEAAIVYKVFPVILIFILCSLLETPLA